MFFNYVLLIFGIRCIKVYVMCRKGKMNYMVLLWSFSWGNRWGFFMWWYIMYVWCICLFDFCDDFNIFRDWIVMRWWNEIGKRKWNDGIFCCMLFFKIFYTFFKMIWNLVIMILFLEIMFNIIVVWNKYYCIYVCVYIVFVVFIILVFKESFFCFF